MRSLWRRTIFLIKEFGMLPLRKIPRTEDSILTSNGQESGVQGAWCNPKGDKVTWYKTRKKKKKRKDKAVIPSTLNAPQPLSWLH